MKTVNRIRPAKGASGPHTLQTSFASPGSISLQTYPDVPLQMMRIWFREMFIGV
jgi:hypothetical protein